ncbi:MAG: Hsp20/alpha crystallin family protein [Opitutae bacterium]|nr:Hsp20/alpha crystallin family protein [Opitutae bacterium]
MSLFNLVPTFSRAAARTESAPAANEPTAKPLYELKATDEAWALTVQLPGVAKDGLEITADDSQLRIVGRRAWKQPAGWTALYRESTDLPYELVLTHDNAVDVEKIHAELQDGVLRASLPKAAAIKPRKIAVN